MPRAASDVYFQLFNEIGILEQLSRAVLEAKLPDGMLSSHFGVLNHLARLKDGQSPNELARAFQVPKTTMTHTLAGLKKNDLVKILPHPRDKRSKCVWLTDKGRRFRETAIHSLRPDFEKLSKQFSPKDVKVLLPHLEALRIIMDAQRDGE
ncbi:MAG: MarR family transcriptional regulator [Pseudomonadota bacterium]